MLVEGTAHTCMQYLSPIRGGGFPGAQGKGIPQPGAPGKNTISSSINNGEGEVWGIPSGVHVPQDKPAYLGITPLKALECPPTEIV